MILSHGVVQLEEEFRVARILRYQFAQLCHHLVVQQIGGQRDGDAVNSLILYRLEELNTRYLQVLGAILIILETWLHLTCNID